MWLIERLEDQRNTPRSDYPEQPRPNPTLAHGVANSEHEMYIPANRTLVPQTTRGGRCASQERHFEEKASFLPPNRPGLPGTGGGKRIPSKPRLMLRPFCLFPFHFHAHWMFPPAECLPAKIEPIHTHPEPSTHDPELAAPLFRPTFKF